MQSIEVELKQAIQNAVKKAFDLDLDVQNIVVETPKNKDHGDFSSNVAMQLTRQLHQNPRMIAQSILDAFSLEMVSNVEIAGPGFLNFTLSKDRFSTVISEVLAQKENYGQQPANGIKVDLEYVSANPTGSLHLGHARGAAWGDSCARIMKKAGYDVTREYYVNDAGNQITNLALSLNARYRQAQGIPTEIGQDGYMGKDVEEKGYELAKEYPQTYLEPTEENLKFFRKEGIKFELDKIRKDLDRYRVHFDVWSSEQSIRDAGKVEAAINELNEKGYVYEKDGALWFETTKFGDDKDRVLRKQDGSLTYLVPDIAYHNDKCQRGFDMLVDFFGADHHGYIPRLKASMTALGNDADKLHVDIIQMVRLVSNGEEMKMSKRLGNATTINELCDKVGVDAARYFFVQRALDSHLDFDIELATKKSNENPVYYAQYAHARMCSIQKQAQDIELATSFEDLTNEKEIELMKSLQEFNKVIVETAQSRQVHKMCHYIQNLASKFHSFYNACKVVDRDNLELSAQRLALVKATQIVLANALECIGVEKESDCQAQINDISYNSYYHVVSPHLTLANDRADCRIIIFRWILIFFQQVLHHLTHTRTGSFFFLPVYRPIFAQHFRKFSGQVNQFIILIEVLYVFRLCQSIVKSQFFLRQAQLFTVVIQFCNLLCRFQKFLDDLLVCNQAIVVRVHQLCNLF